MMNKFIRKAFLFLLPITLVVLTTYSFYSTKEGDLIRLGYLPNIFLNYYSQEKFTTPKKNEIAYEQLYDLPTKRKYKIMTIGDSFSEAKESGYNNLLAQKFDLLHSNRSVTQWNTIEFLHGLCQGDFFDNFDIEYVILQNIEREIYSRISYFSPDSIYNLTELYERIKKDKEVENEVKSSSSNSLFNRKLFTNEPFEFVQNSFYFFIKDNYEFEDKVYKIKLDTNHLFSTKTDFMLCFSEDINDLEEKNKLETALRFNELMNELQEMLNQKGVKLIVLNSADKYSTYYEYIEDKELFVKPLLLDNIQELPKNYIYLDNRTIMDTESITDLYYYDDTHWSTIGQQLVADKLIEIILKDSER